MRVFAVVGAVCAAMVLVGCRAPAAAATPEALYEVVAQATLTEGAIPAPVGDVVLTITGAIGMDNVGGEVNSVEFDMETLEALGLVEYETFDPDATGADNTFQGVLLSVLLDAVEVDPSATTIQAIALNNYEAPLPISDAADWSVLIATQMNNAYLSIEDFGPTRIVYPYNDFELEQEVYNARWVWSLHSLVIE